MDESVLEAGIRVFGRKGRDVVRQRWKGRVLILVFQNGQTALLPRAFLEAEAPLDEKCAALERAAVELRRMPRVDEVVVSLE